MLIGIELPGEHDSSNQPEDLFVAVVEDSIFKYVSWEKFTSDQEILNMKTTTHVDTRFTWLSEGGA